MSAKSVGEIAELKKNAFFYLSQNIDKAPDSIKDIVTKMADYSSRGDKVMGIMETAERTLNEAREQMSQLHGAINALIDLCTDKMTDEDLEAFAACGVAFAKSELAKSGAKQ
jgi:uncharacterized protein YaiE (UPF0345 family)